MYYSFATSLPPDSWGSKWYYWYFSETKNLEIVTLRHHLAVLDEDGFDPSKSPAMAVANIDVWLQKN